MELSCLHDCHVFVGSGDRLENQYAVVSAQLPLTHTYHCSDWRVPFALAEIYGTGRAKYAHATNIQYNVTL